MGESEDFKAGQERGEMIAEMRAVRSSVDGLKKSVEDLGRDLSKESKEHGTAITTLQTDFKNISREVEGLESAKTWIVRTVGGSIILALLGIVYKLR